MFALVTAICLATASNADWTVSGGLVRGVGNDQAPNLMSLGAAPAKAFSLSFQVRVDGGTKFHSVGAYFGRHGDDYSFAYVSVDSPETKSQIAARTGGQMSYPSDQALQAKWRMNTWYRFELRVRPPIANLLVDGKLQCGGPAGLDASREVGLLVFDADAQFRDVKLRRLSASEVVAATSVAGPDWTSCRTRAVKPWGAYISEVARFADSDVGVAGARRDPDAGVVPPYLYHAVIDPDDKLTYDGAYPAFHHALFIQGFLNCYRYFGDEKWLKRARQLADWDISHSSPADCLYPNLPFSTVWQGKMGGFQDRDGLMLDKVGWTGLAYLRLWGTTGEAKYLRAARLIGDTLLKVQNPDGSWWFRVLLHNPEPTQKYTGNQVFNVQFLDRLERVTKTRRYLFAADRAWAWLKDNPLRTGKWEAFYEDVDPNAGSIGNWDAIEAGIELLRRGQTKPAEEIADWVRARYGVARSGRGIGINEQTACFIPMNCHTLHWCRLVAQLYKVTGKRKYRDAVISAVNLCTANTWKDGRSPTDVYSSGPDGCWYSLSFSPLYLGLDILADFPERAPKDENHILSATADLRSVRYAKHEITYETAGPSTETLVLRVKPIGATIGGIGAKWSWNASLHLATLSHMAGRVEVQLGK